MISKDKIAIAFYPISLLSIAIVLRFYLKSSSLGDPMRVSFLVLPPIVFSLVEAVFLWNIFKLKICSKITVFVYYLFLFLWIIVVFYPKFIAWGVDYIFVLYMVTIPFFIILLSINLFLYKLVVFKRQKCDSNDQ